MKTIYKFLGFLEILIAIALGAALLAASTPATAASSAKIDQDVDAVLKNLFKTTPSAEKLAHLAKGILVFPSIVKGGLIVGGQYGEGALRKGSKTVGYYNTVSASYGLQAGLQKYGYVLFFMSDTALSYLDKSSGFEIGAGPSVVIVDEGKAASLTTTTVQDDIYAFLFDQKGLMGGLGLQGTKITKVEK